MSATGSANPTVLDFARIASAVYGPTFGGPISPRTSDGSFEVLGSGSRTAMGFKGALYCRASSDGSLDLVAAICGTEGTADYGNDIIADAGYGEGSARVNFVQGMLSTTPLGPLMASFRATASMFLRSQMNSAIALAELAKTVSAGGRHRRAYITGHSLGGGLAQIASAYTGLRAVTFNPAACTGVTGVAGAYQSGGGAIVNFQIMGDPVNATGAVGDWLGDCITIASRNRPSLGSRHMLGPTVAELERGDFEALGRMNPFWFIGRGGYTAQPGRAPA